jgi:hypothetical protein
MKKLVTTAVVLGALSAGIFAPSASARVAAPGDMTAMTAACWRQVHQIMPGYGTDGGADRRREFLLDACMQNGGRIP